MNNHYQLVIFDWEGTLGDTLGQILVQVREEALKLHFGELDEQRARQYVGLGLSKAVAKLFPHLELRQQEQLLEAVSKALAVRHNAVCLLPGAKEAVVALSEAGMDLAIATNKGEASLKRALHCSGMDAYVKVFRCAGTCPPKPCPQMLEDLLNVFGCQATQAVMIGDSEDDMSMAKAIGMDAIGVDFYGNGAESLLKAGAKAVFSDYASLLKHLLHTID